MRSDELTARVAQLLRAVPRALAGVGVSGAHILGRPVEVAPVLWQTPPIRPDTEVTGPNGNGFSVDGSLFGGRVSYTLPAIGPAIAVYRETLKLLATEPFRAVSPTGLSMLAGTVFRLGVESPLLLSVPEIEKGKVSPEARAVFAVEFAMLLKMCGWGEFHAGESDCWVSGDGWEVGLRHGVVIGQPQAFTADLQLLLSTYRGQAWEGPEFGVIERLAKWWDEEGAQHQELSGLRDVLTVLQCLATPEEKVWLEAALFQFEPKKVKAYRAREIKKVDRRIVLEAQKLFEDTSVVDSLRIFRLLEKLVPAVLTQAGFNRTIWDMEKRIRTLSPRKEASIRNELIKLLARSEDDRDEGS